MDDLAVRTTPLPGSDALLPLLRTDGVAWLRRGEGLVGWGEAARFEPGPGEDRFERAGEWLAELVGAADIDDPLRAPGTGLVALASFTFDPRSHGSVVTVPSTVVGRRGDRTWVTRVGTGAVPDDGPLPQPFPAPAPTTDRVRYAGSSLPDLRWLEAVAEALDRIGNGELEKVVLARDHAVWSQDRFDVRLLAARLAERFPECFTFVVEGLVGATPELLVRRTGRAVTSRVLAGSARRDPSPREDSAIGAALLDSAKDRTEHRLAVTSVTAVLAERCTTLEADHEPRLLRLANVQHLATGVTGTLRGTPSALQLAAALHPTAAVGGVPPERALETIRELEGMDRGRYSGPVGWMDARGDGEFAIALRCAELLGARARLFAGAGIVPGSLPEDELEETRLKLRAMQSAFEA